MADWPVYGHISGPIVIVGFGSIGRGTLPLIERHFTYDRERVCIIDPDPLNKWIADASSRPWIIERALKPFARGENLLAYQRVFMNPFHPKLLPGVSDRALAINDEVDAAIARIYEEMFRLNGEGMPGSLVLEKTFAIAKSALEFGYLVPMQDAKWFEEIFARR